MKKFALIVAGGNGTRMESEVPKQFIEIGGRPVLMHTFNVFTKYDGAVEFVLVLPKDQIHYWEHLCKKHRFATKHQIAAGGETRFQSVKNGLDLLPPDGIVFIHDGVRPLVSEQTIGNCYFTACEKGNALPVMPVNNSLRMVTSTDSRAVDRSQFVSVQTPQTFKLQIIKKAYGQANNTNFTDDASVLEAFGENINLVEGNPGNIKITYPADLIFARSLLAQP